MESKSKINIISQYTPEFNSNITVDNVIYHVQTEDTGPRKYKLISRVYLRGEVVFTRSSDYVHLSKFNDLKDRLSVLMGNQHKTTIDLFGKELSKKKKLKSEYLYEVKKLVQKGKGKEALETLKVGVAAFPSDPFLLSYYGCLLAIVEKTPSEGIKICRDAIERLDKAVPFGKEFFYPVFYLNLGRAYLKGKKKQEAVAAFQEGLRNDPENRDLQWEMRKLGMRKSPAVRFLRRENPLNKYIGMLRDTIGK
jgi:tetratricopeptide (TPR) repeat protein